ncbi:MAG: hypothetical protein CME70_18960 [Halobacteriovorax sp.]|nr:hypothetical protein [Halobacteriovorax sp.]|tara:strand:- start:596 stop:859 length:264 start_codon:yes stop_codon:yes gene_type:complete
MDPRYFRKIDIVLKINDVVHYEDFAANAIMAGVITGYEAGHYLVKVCALPEHGIYEEMIIWREREDLMTTAEWNECGRPEWFGIERR